MDRIRIGYPAGYLRFFWIRIGFIYFFFWIKLDQDQDIFWISVTKFSWEWFKTWRCHKWWSCCFLCYDFYIHKKSKWFRHYVLHSSQLMIIRVTSLQFFFRRGGSSKLLLYCWYAAGLSNWSFGDKFQKFGPKQNLLTPKFSFAPLGLFWPFSRIDWLLARIRSDHPVFCLRNQIFSLFWLIYCRFSPNSYIFKVFDYKILFG